MNDHTRNVAIFIFDDVEALDFCAPFEVFSVTKRRDGGSPFNVYTVAEERRPVIARGGLSVNPRYSFGDCPLPDVLLVPGGHGTRREMENATALDWIKRRASEAELVLSVCTGALVLARAGLLDDLTATTHASALNLLREVAPNTIVDETKRYVDNGKVIVSAGVAAGLDMSLHTIARLLGSKTARETARYIEYDWKSEEV